MVLSAMISANVTETASQTPASLQRRNRRQIVFQLPYSNGTSRQGVPQQSRQITTARACLQKAALEPKACKAQSTHSRRVNQFLHAAQQALQCGDRGIRMLDLSPHRRAAGHRFARMAPLRSD
jgi:hypothetical protein